MFSNAYGYFVVENKFDDIRREIANLNALGGINIDYLKKTLKELADDITASEGCALALDTLNKVFRVNCVLDIIAETEEKDKWGVFFDTLRSLNLSSEDRYYFVFCFNAFKKLQIINATDYNELLRRYNEVFQ